MNELENQRTDRDKIWCGDCAIEDYPEIVILQCVIENGRGPPTPIMETFSKNYSSRSRRGLRPKPFQPFGVQVPDSHSINGVFAKDRLTDEINLLPVAIAPCLNMSRPSFKTPFPEV
jgi:hypothetical protein